MLKGEKIAGTYRVTMSRAPVNAFDAEFVDAWYRVLDEVADSGCAILHVRSSEKVFSAGADLKMMRTFFAGASAGEKLVAHVKRMQDVFNRIEALPNVTLAEISGSALGGGFELALACDLRVAGHGALLGLPESRIGLIPGAGGTQRLAKLCGIAPQNVSFSAATWSTAKRPNESDLCSGQLRTGSSRRSAARLQREYRRVRRQRSLRANAAWSRRNHPSIRALKRNGRKHFVSWRRLIRNRVSRSSSERGARDERSCGSSDAPCAAT